MPEQHVALVVMQGKDRIAGVAVQFLLVANSLVVPKNIVDLRVPSLCQVMGGCGESELESL